MLDVSKIQTGKLIYEDDYFDLDKLVLEVAEDILHTVGKGYLIKISGKTEERLHGDRYRIYQVLSNLLTNAVKYSPVNKNILVRLNKDNNYVKVSIKDWGIGIAPDKINKIFERFYRIDPSYSMKGGFASLGMGLYISSGIVKRHKGLIKVKSIPGKGSEFSLILPMDVKFKLKNLIGY